MIIIQDIYCAQYFRIVLKLQLKQGLCIKNYSYTAQRHELQKKRERNWKPFECFSTNASKFKMPFHECHQKLQS